MDLNFGSFNKEENKTVENTPAAPPDEPKSEPAPATPTPGKAAKPPNMAPGMGTTPAPKPKPAAPAAPPSGGLKGLNLSDPSGMVQKQPKEVEFEKRLAETKAKLVANIKEKVKAPRAQQLLDLMDKMKFWTAPASSRKEYHGCYPGGLTEHTHLVVAHMLRLNKAWECGVDEDSIVVAGVLHDIAKAGFLEKQYYLPETSDWHRNKLGQMYQYNKELPAMGQNTMSIYMAMHAGIHLSVDEFQAILGQDGMYSDESKSVFANKGGAPEKLAYLMHFSDCYVAMVIGI